MARTLMPQFMQLNLSSLSNYLIRDQRLPILSIISIEAVSVSLSSKMPILNYVQITVESRHLKTNVINFHQFVSMANNLHSRIPLLTKQLLAAAYLMKLSTIISHDNFPSLFIQPSFIKLHQSNNAAFKKLCKRIQQCWNLTKNEISKKMMPKILT